MGDTSFFSSSVRVSWLVICSRVTAVPSALTTTPHSPSRSKHCLYPTTAFAPRSSTLSPIFLFTSPLSLKKSVCLASFVDRGVLILSNH
uniref:Putative secreted protein n=1 Tax=Panstrongylus lignarius TaxID=156445 RepID=A0A224Y3L3_9HEMI